MQIILTETKFNTVRDKKTKNLKLSVFFFFFAEYSTNLVKWVGGVDAMVEEDLKSESHTDK